MEVTDIGNKEEGKVWHRKPTPGKSVLATVVRTAQQSKTVRFLHVSFDTTGDSFLAGDHHGNIYFFDISRNRFRLVQRTGQACTALAFSLRRTTEFLVALVDHTIKCFDKDTKQLVSWMRGHEGAVTSISVHSSGRYAITTSSDTAQLWDLDTFQRKRKLNIRQSVGIQKVFFLPLSNTILSCFSDDSIFAWESDTLFCRYQLPVPDSGPRIFYKAFAVTRDGKSLAAGGRSNLLHLWCLESQQLVRVIQMPSQVRTVRQLEFLPESFDGGASQTLGVLSQDGVMRFINIHTCKLLFHMGSVDEAITAVAVGPNGRHIAAIMDNGRINIYSVQSLTQELSKPLLSRVAVVSGGGAGHDFSNIKMKVRSEAVRPARRSGRGTQVKILRPPAGSSAEDKENELPAGLNKKRLVALLKAFGEFPAKYRMFVWKSLLCLPENHAAYSSLTDKGLHSAFLTLHDKYPIKSHKLQRGLQRLLSALAHWAAIFAEVEYIPLLSFPFVKLFQNNPMLCFEVLATVIVNWCQHWFEYFPNPPLNILSMAENILAHHDKELLQHLMDCGISSQLYVWPLLETMFSEVLTRDEWLRLFDNVFSNHPSFLLMACVAYVISCREPLLLCSQKKDFEYFFHHRNNLDVGAMIKEAYRITGSTPAAIHPRTLLSDFTPLTSGQYPIFNQYPEFIVEYQSRERERIRLQEMEYLKERRANLNSTNVTASSQLHDDVTTSELLQKAEEQRRNILAQEEEKLAQQRTKLTAMKRELKVKELHLLDATRRRFLKHQQDLRASQIQRLDQEINRKIDQREQETAAAVQDLEVRQMELEVQRKRLEQDLMKKQERVGREVEEEVQLKMRAAERADETGPELLHGAESNLQALEESLAEAYQLGLESDWQREVLGRLQQVEAEQERKRDLLAELRRKTLAEEEKLAHTVREVAGRKVRIRFYLFFVGVYSVEEKQIIQVKFDLRLQNRERLLHRPAASVAAKGVNTVTTRSSAATQRQEGASMVCLNSTSPSGSSTTNFSLDRGRALLDSSERELLKEIRELRQKLAARARESSSPSVPTPSSVS
uniref:TBC1 domain family member 31 n=1 Tax=Xiphophorus couchianus TaxID=32473 RepID=A0A3B5MFS1_9TELE